MSGIGESTWIWLHLGFIFAGLAGLAAAVASAGIYLFQSLQLKSKNPGKVFLRLPSLEALDKIHFRSLGGGVVLFSLGILTGFFWAKTRSELDRIIHDPTAMLSLIACSLYWVLLSLRVLELKRGRKIAIGTVLAFTLLFGTLVSTAYAPVAFHRGL